MMNISCHPLENLGLCISVISANVEGSIELKQKFFIAMFLVSHKVEQTRITEAIKGFFKAWQSSNGFTIKMHMREDASLIVQDA